MLVFAEGGKPEYPEKNPRSRDENQQQTQPTYDTETGNRTWATLVGGLHGRPMLNHCAIPARDGQNVCAVTKLGTVLKAERCLLTASGSVCQTAFKGTGYNQTTWNHLFVAIYFPLLFLDISTNHLSQTETRVMKNEIF